MSVETSFQSKTDNLEDKASQMRDNSVKPPKFCTGIRVQVPINVASTFMS
jgi:hypothetical protein